MFCGTGKTRILFDYILTENKDRLSVIVFPSLSLIAQFSEDYVNNEKWKHITKNFNFLSVCSKDESNSTEYTTDSKSIKKYIKKHKSCIIAVTYHSFETLLSVVDELHINIKTIIFDEAHHIIGNTIQKIVFSDDFTKNVEKTIFFTATQRPHLIFFEKVYMISSKLIKKHQILNIIQILNLS
jgi:superfamily II DNA or RNA helicase